MSKAIKIAHIVAYDSQGVIGVGDDKLPWDIKEDLKRFKEITTGHAVVMGRKTYFSIGRPLPNRKNIVISRHPENLNKVVGVCSIDKAVKLAIEYAEQNNQERIFIIGGGEIYDRTKDIVDEIFATLVLGEHQGDRFYRIPMGFECVECSGELTNGVEKYLFKKYVRKQ